MQDIFSLKRFILLLQNHLVESRKKYTLFSVSVFAIGFMILLLFFVFNTHDDYNCYCVDAEGKTDYISRNGIWHSMQPIIYWGGLYLFGGMFALASYINFGNQGEAVFYMNKPASVFEKWAVEVFVRIVLFFVVYSCIFYLLFAPSTLLYNSIEYSSYQEFYATHPYGKTFMQHYCNGGSKPVFESSTLYSFTEPNNADSSELRMLNTLLFSIYVSGVAFFMYGAVLFNKFSFFKTFLLGFAIFIIFTLYGFCIAINGNIFITEGWNHRIFSTTAHNIDNWSLYVSMTEAPMMRLFYIFSIFIPVALLTVGYFKLKEKQV